MGGGQRGPSVRGTSYCFPMPPKGWTKYTPEQLSKLQEAYRTMSLEDAAASVGMTRGAAFFQLQSRGLMRKEFAALVEMKPVVMDERELHYFAGLLDGEGTVTVRRINRGKGRKHSFKPSLCVSNTDKRMMDWVMDRAPGAWLDTPRRSPTGTLCYRVFVEGLGQLPLYQALEPVLVIKSDLMAAVIEWSEIRLSQSRTDPLTKRQLEIVQQIRARNMSPSSRYANGTYGTFLSTTSRPAAGSTT